MFTQPIERLQAIAEQLEKTGTLTGETVTELRQIVNVLADTPTSPDSRAAALLSFAAEVSGGSNFSAPAESLVTAADMLPGRQEITELRGIAEMISAAAETIRCYGGER